MRNLLKTYKGLPREIYIIFIGKTITCIGAFVYPLLSLILTQKVGLSTGEAGKFITILAIAQAPCIILGGKLADKIGRKKAILIFQVLGILFYLICGMIKPSMALVICIIIASCCFSAAAPAYDALNADLTTPSNRKAAFSLIYMGVNLGYAIGPIIGGFLYNNYLNLIFIGDALTTLVALTLFMIYVKEPKKSSDEEESNSLEKDEEGGVIGILIKRPILIVYSLAMLAFQFGYSQWAFALPIQMGDVFGEKGAALYGLLGGLNGILVVTLTPIITYLTRKNNIIKVMTFGGLLYSMAFVVLGIANIYSLFIIAAIILTIGEIAIAINSGTFIANRTPASHRGRVNAIIPLIYGCGHAFGPNIMGKMLDVINIQWAWYIIAFVVFVGCIIMYSLIYYRNDNVSLEK